METTKKLNKAQRNPGLTRPTSLTRCGMWNMHKANLVAWARSACLLEHLSDDEVAALTKGGVVEECLGAFLRLEVAEEHEVAAGVRETSRSLDELVYGPAAA